MSESSRGRVRKSEPDGVPSDELRLIFVEMRAAIVELRLALTDLRKPAPLEESAAPHPEIVEENPPPPENALLLTPEQVAELLQVEVASLRRWVTDELVPFHRVGRKTRFSQADLDAIIEGSQVSAVRSVNYGSRPRRRRS